MMIAINAITANVISIDRCKALLPASSSTTNMASVAYATEDKASDARIGSAWMLGNVASAAALLGSGLPRSKRLMFTINVAN
jgi:hypothetical protein